MSPPRDITVVIIERHRMVADGLAQILSLESDMGVRGIATRIGDAFELIARHRPDVILLDLTLLAESSSGLIREIHALSVNSKVLLLATSKKSALENTAAHDGSSGVLSLELAGQDVIEAVRGVCAGHVDLGSANNRALEDVWYADSRRRTDELTPREIEVLRLLAHAHSTKEIARRLDVSIHTVKNHTYNIFLKLGAHSRMEAITEAIQRGILDSNDIGVSSTLAVG